MRAGERNKRIVIEDNQPTRGADGSLTDNWVTIATVWAEVKMVRGWEQDGASDQRAALQHTEFRILRHPGLKPTCRIQWRGAIFDIKDLSEIGDNEGVRILALGREVPS